jgi:hypothetical protein
MPAVSTTADMLIATLTSKAHFASTEGDKIEY